MSARDEERAPAPAFADHFSEVADRYAACRPDQPPEVLAFAASLAPRRALAWDCGTGSGQAARGLAPFFERVVATDASAAQVARAAPHPRVEYRVARAEASGLADSSVDLVTAAQALHWFDLDAFWREVRRVAAPGAAVVVWSYLWATIDEPSAAAVLRELSHETLAPDWPPQIRIVADGYRTIPFPFHEVEAPPFTFEAAWTLPELLGFVRTWSGTARHVARTGRDPVAAVEPRLAAAWGDPERRRTIRWPIALRAGRVHVPFPAPHT